jgi:hypothetical protein
VLDKIRQVNQAAIVENKHLDAALLMAKLMQKMLPPRKRNNNGAGPPVAGAAHVCGAGSRFCATAGQAQQWHYGLMVNMREGVCSKPDPAPLTVSGHSDSADSLLPHTQTAPKTQPEA